MGDIASWVATILTGIGVIVQAMLRVSPRFTWRSDLLKDIEIYERLSSNSSLGNKEVKKSIKKEIEGKLAEKYTNHTPSKIWVFFVNTIMLWVSVMAAIVVGVVAGLTDTMTPDLAGKLLLLIGATAGLEVLINIFSILKK